MCYIAFVKKNKDQALDTTTAEMLWQTIASEAETNNDGFALLNDKKKAHRTMGAGQYEDVLWAELTSERTGGWLLTHQRLATHGKVSLDNVHLWNINGFTFCHNGIMSELGSAQLSDSLVYFRMLTKDLEADHSAKNIVETIKRYEHYFSGRAFLVTPDNHVYCWGDFTAYLLAGAVLVSSCKVMLEATEKIKWGDVNFERKKELGEIPDVELNGIYHFTDNGVKKIGEMRIGYQFENVHSNQWWNRPKYQRPLGFQADEELDDFPAPPVVEAIK